jgi:transketolase
MKGPPTALLGMSHDIAMLEERARRCRVEIVRMVHRAQAGHPGGSLSEIDLLVGLYGTVLNVRPDEPSWPGRDRFVLSKGHASPGMYALLADLGFITHEDLTTYRVKGGVCQGHVDMKWCPGVDFSAGSLGMGLSFGLGCALAARLDGSQRKAWVMMGDGEVQEGSVWEAAMAAHHHSVGNLKAIVDVNGIQNDDFCEVQMQLNDLAATWASFGWSVTTVDGHNMADIVEALAKVDAVNDRPAVLLASTVKGKGVSYMENNPAFHGAAPNDEQFETAMVELGEVAA